MAGEIRDGRAIIDRHTQELIDHGVKPGKAEQMARDSMRRVDRQQREQGKR